MCTGCFQWFKDTNLKANHNRMAKNIYFTLPAAIWAFIYHYFILLSLALMQEFCFFAYY